MDINNEKNVTNEDYNSCQFKKGKMNDNLAGFFIQDESIIDEYLLPLLLHYIICYDRGGG